MIKVNSKVIIKGLVIENDTNEPQQRRTIEKIKIGIDITKYDTPLHYGNPVVMIVEGLYWRAIKDSTEMALPILSKEDENIDQLNEDVYMKCAKCLWYNTQNELQSEFINLELLTEL